MAENALHVDEGCRSSIKTRIPNITDRPLHVLYLLNDYIHCVLEKRATMNVLSVGSTLYSAALVTRQSCPGITALSNAFNQRAYKRSICNKSGTRMVCRVGGESSAAQPGDFESETGPILQTGDAFPPTNVPPGGNGDGGDGNNDENALLLMAAGRTVQSLPLDMVQAMKNGTLPKDMLKRYLDMTSNGFLAWLMQFGGFRERLLADPGFFVKVAIEVGIGICTKTTAEYTKRGDQFESQLDFVFANICMALVADFMLVWLPAPTYAASKSSVSAGKNGGLLSSLNNVFKGCPDNAFQKVPPGYQPFTFGQRCGAVVRNGAKLFGVGFFASLLGVGLTNGLIAVRELMDPTFVPLNAPQDVATMSAAYGLYMASSSNLRYQILAGILEERGIEVIFKSNPAICAALSFAVRTGNTFLGSLLWVDFLNIIGLQKIGGH